MPHKPREYKHIRAWGLMMGSFEYYIKQQQAEASEDNAPLDAIYKRGGTWFLFRDIENEQTKEQVKYYLSQMKG